MKATAIGAVFASFIWVFLIVAFNFETRLPMPAGWDNRYHISEAAVTENRRLVDSATDTTVLWTPGNPKTNVVSVRETVSGRWEIVIEKVY